MLRIAISYLIILFVVILGSVVSGYFWAGEKEQMPQSMTIAVDEGMTVAEFGRQNDLGRKVLKKVFGLSSPNDLERQVADFAMSQEQLSDKVNKVLAIQAEHASKNWFKIPLKGGLWIFFLSAVFVMLRKGKVSARNRKWIYVAAVGIFGIFLGSDPSPMGTVKDTAVLLGSKGVIFPPRLVALGIFLLMVMFANKFICSWGCQFGTLQDLIFRLNRDAKDRKGVFGQVKVPFVVSNSTRILFFLVLTSAAFIWALDIVGLIDPFKIFKPQVIGLVGGLFVVSVLGLSLFTYRPWCHFFCPFGLVSWLVEKVSIFRIKVDYDKCVSCEACSQACPSMVMDAILKQDKVVPDCFSCGTCIEVCPAGAISFDRGKCPRPPAGKFSQKVMSNDEQ